MHYRAPPDGRPEVDETDEWQTTRPRGVASPPSIPNWIGRVDMAYASLEAPLQAFAGDVTDPANTALYGCRVSERPNTWINWKALDVTPGVAPELVTRDGDIVGARWPDLWPGATLSIEHGGHKLAKAITITSRSAPTVYRFTARIPGGHTLDLADGSRVVLRDNRGEVAMSTDPVWALDGVGLPPDQRKPVGCSMAREPDVTVRGVGRLPVFAIHVNADDIATATLPIEVDPTVTISAASAIDDTYIEEDYPTYNFGATTLIYTSLISTKIRRPMVKIANGSDIPAGTITACRMYQTVRSDSKAVNWYRISDANTWIEGRGTGAAVDGEPTWNLRAHGTPGTAWAGSAGCLTAGTDYVDSVIASQPYMGGGTSYIPYTLTIDTAAVTHWRDVASNGMIGVGLSYLYLATCESATPSYRPYFEIDYVLGGAAAMLARRIHE
jgi:hypothetical protein